jgi:hypothetical protein
LNSKELSIGETILSRNKIICKTLKEKYKELENSYFSYLIRIRAGSSKEINQFNSKNVLSKFSLD